MRGSIGMAALLLCACGERDAAPAPPTASPARVVAKALSPGAAPAPEAAQVSATPASLALPARFTALGTEPFWAAKVDGPRLTYSTPEDQAGQAITVTRTPQGDRVDVVGTLGGQRMTLAVSAGPCSDGMSDTVYPFAVRRRLGDDEQRGCARPD